MVLREQQQAWFDTALTASSGRFDGERTPAIGERSGDVRGRQNRVVLTPGACASSLAVMWRPDRVRRVSHPQGDGGNSASLPGESAT